VRPSTFLSHANQLRGRRIGAPTATTSNPPGNGRAMAAP
jgi:hypothetical protein